MKKIALLFILINLLFIAAPRDSCAANEDLAGIKTDSSNASITTTISPLKTDLSEKPKTEYTLPYPGILPDHPLYVLKNFRDSILEMLISDPTRKIEFYILQSDKEVSATQFLYMNKKTSYIKNTVEHAIVYKQKAISQAKLIKTQGKEVPGFLIERLTNSNQKHIDVLTELVTSDNDLKKIIDDSNEKVNSFQTDIDSLKK